MNSMLWELCDGSRTFSEVCLVMNDVFQEDIAPVLQRSAAAIGLLQSKNLMLLLDEPLNGRWSVGPGKPPSIRTSKNQPKRSTTIGLRSMMKRLDQRLRVARPMEPTPIEPPTRHSVCLDRQRNVRCCGSNRFP